MKIERKAGRCHKGSNMNASLHVRPMYVVAHEFTRVYMYMLIQLCMCEYECMCVYMNACMPCCLSVFEIEDHLPRLFLYLNEFF